VYLFTVACKTRPQTQTDVVPIIVLGNKVDLDANRVVEKAAASALKGIKLFF